MSVVSEGVSSDSIISRDVISDSVLSEDVSSDVVRCEGVFTYAAHSTVQAEGSTDMCDAPSAFQAGSCDLCGRYGN